ncbi:MAG: hypothetical protein JXR77_10485, partial [Lentisphaeria bacterium]|nr:hypothetical protein [Lentisphaeria bacterium]
MHLLMAIGGSSGCVAIPALVSAMRRRGWRVTPLPLAGSERFLTGDFLRELCAVDPLPARAAHPPVDAALIAPCPPLHPASRKTLRGRWLPELGAEVPLLLLPEWPTSEAALPACPERWSAAAPRTCLLLPQGPPPCR